jgi:hypothetical protein
VVHADAGGLPRLTASSSSVAATVAPSVRIVPATAVARSGVSGVRVVLSAADTDSVVGRTVVCRADGQVGQPGGRYPFATLCSDCAS